MLNYKILLIPSGEILEIGIEPKNAGKLSKIIKFNYTYNMNSTSDEYRDILLELSNKQENKKNDWVKLPFDFDFKKKIKEGDTLRFHPMDGRDSYYYKVENKFRDNMILTMVDEHGIVKKKIGFSKLNMYYDKSDFFQKLYDIYLYKRDNIISDRWIRLLTPYHESGPKGLNENDILKIVDKFDTFYYRTVSIGKEKVALVAMYKEDGKFKESKDRAQIVRLYDLFFTKYEVYKLI